MRLAATPSPPGADPAVSVVVPVYNVERYLEQCLASIGSQTLRDIEIVVVNDGSTDGSQAIIDAFAARDPRVVVVAQSNAGYGAAVNAGLARARGRYLAIVESDDWIEPAMLQVLFDAGAEAGADIVKGCFRKVLPNGRTLRMSFEGLPVDHHQRCDPAQSLDLMVFESSIWSALYRRAALQARGIRMLDVRGRAYQDVVWKFMTYASLGPVRLVDLPLYNYRVLAAGSSSGRKTDFDAHFRNYEVIRSYLREQGHWAAFAASYYVHQFFDFRFHANRLAPAGRREFLAGAERVVVEAREAGVDPFAVVLHGRNARYYYRSKVLPLLARLQCRTAWKRGRFLTAGLSLWRWVAWRIAMLVWPRRLA